MTNLGFDSLTRAVEFWISQDPDSKNLSQLETLLIQHLSRKPEATSQLQNLFGSRLAFGTAGIRGPVRPGPNGMNRVLVSQTTAGLSQFLLRSREPMQAGLAKVVVGCDARNNSDVFANDALEVLSGYGIEAIALPIQLPTPVLAFAVRHLEADAGVMVTASHNPREDNGYKVYLGGANAGSQIISPADREIEELIKTIAAEKSFREIPRSTTHIVSAPSEVVRSYLERTVPKLSPSKSQSTLNVVYTAMHGVGGGTFLAAMAKSGFPRPHVVEQQFHPDPDFPTVAFPNPEEKGALDLSFKKARSVTGDLIIAHDPDADRLAVALPDPSAPGGYRALTGNQIGAIFGWHIAQKISSLGRTGSLANSLVSSPVLGKIANHFGLDHEETLTGFKYVSRVKNLIFGFEEALGYFVTPDVVRDKDGISAGLLMVSIAHTLASEGRTLWDYLNEIEESVGAFASGQVTIRLSPGVAGSMVTTGLRERELSALGSRSVTDLDDFLEGVSNFPKEDILRYYLDDVTRVIARPSGTEPKVKVYIDTEGATSAEAQSRLAEVESDVNELVSSL